jgi:hypothetical protein
MPERRRAVCVSPSPDLAREASVQSAGLVRVYRVRPSSDVVLAQSSYQDAKFHPDVRGETQGTGHQKPLHRALLDWLPAWVDRDADAKKAIAPLWAPCLSQAEVDQLFKLEPLAGIRETVWNAIGFWRDVQGVALDAEWPFPKGEGFFNASFYEVVETTGSGGSGRD